MGRARGPAEMRGVGCGPASRMFPTAVPTSGAAIRADRGALSRDHGPKTVRTIELIGVRSGFPQDTPTVELRLYW